MDPLTLEQAQREVSDRAFETIITTITIPMAVTLIAQLQLALRHPSNTGPSADQARYFAAYLINQLNPPEALSKLLNAGWDPNQDVIVEIDP
jgi:hypothetical protein